MAANSGGPPRWLSPLLNSGAYSDLTMTCKETQWRLHQAVVCPQSLVIAITLGNDSSVFGSLVKIYKADRFDPETIGRFIHFLYLGVYHIGSRQNPTPNTTDVETEESETVPTLTNPFASASTAASSTSSLLPVTEAATSGLGAVINLNIAANFFQVPELAAATRTHVQKILEESWDAKIFPGLLQLAGEKAKDEKLMDIMLKATHLHLNELMKTPQFRSLKCLSGISLWILGRIDPKTTQYSAHRVNKRKPEEKPLRYSRNLGIENLNGDVHPLQFPTHYPTRRGYPTLTNTGFQFFKRRPC